MSTIVAGTAAPSTTRRPRGGLWRAILHNRKAMVGAVLLVLFCLLAAFPHLFVPGLHGDPQAIGDLPLQHPSAKHWLGTTGLGQDVYAQLVYGTRQSLVIAVVAAVLRAALVPFQVCDRERAPARATRSI